ncbi:hypothetical protein HYU50_05065 [Candidatus Woesearchaeota archaeon]|nr:hypothetical protein [Candidatus Woesearchaeota archaeon]
MFRKSQAALEFLMTYGWAILVVLVAIGALAYFGVLSPDKFLPSKCTLPAGIACMDHRASGGTNQLSVTLRNGMGFDTTSVGIYATGCTASTGNSLANGQQTNYNLACAVGPPPTLASGSKYNGDLNITYTNSETQLTHKLQGAITTRVE